MTITRATAWATIALGALAASTPLADPAPAPPCPCHQPKAATATGVQRTTGKYAAPPVGLVDQHGKAVDLNAALSGSRPVALNFIFTSCRTICPVLSTSFANLHREAGSAVQFVSISIDPEYDTPRVLDAYAKRFDVGPGWMLLTGKSDAIAAVRKAFDAASGSKDGHRPLTFLRPAGSSEWVRLEGFPSTGELVAALGVKEATAAR